MCILIGEKNKNSLVIDTLKQEICLLYVGIDEAKGLSEVVAHDTKFRIYWCTKP